MSVLLVGLGRRGEKHVRVLRELGVDLWVADISAERRAWAVERGVASTRAVPDARDAIDVVEAADIVTPADSHRDRPGLPAGGPPLLRRKATRPDEGRRARACRGRKAGLSCLAGRAYLPVPSGDGRPAGRAAKGRIGSVRFATGRFAGFKRPRTDVGVTHTDAIHYFDLFAYLFDRSATSVLAVQRDHLGRGLDDLSLTTVRYGDVTAIVQADYFVPGTPRECVIVGERGALVADYGASTVVFHPGEHRKRGSGWDAIEGPVERVTVTGDEPLRAELAAFLAAAQGQAPNLVGADAGVHALEIVEAAALSARARREVVLSELP